MGQGEEGDHQGDPRADAADVGEEEAGEEEGGEEGEEAEEEEGEEEKGQEEEEKEEEEGQEEEEEKEEEEGREVPGRQAAEGRPQEQGVDRGRQEERGGDEEEGRRALRHQDAVRRPRCGLRQDQDVPLGGDEGALGVHQEEQAPVLRYGAGAVAWSASRGGGLASPVALAARSTPDTTARAR